MKASHVALFVAGVQAQGWNNWAANTDVTVTATVTNTQTVCPCETDDSNGIWKPWQTNAAGDQLTTICPHDGQCYVSTRTHTAEATLTQTVCPSDGPCSTLTETFTNTINTNTVNPGLTSTTSSSVLFPNGTSSSIVSAPSTTILTTANFTTSTTTNIGTPVFTSTSLTTSTISVTPVSSTSATSSTTVLVAPGATQTVSVQGLTYVDAMLQQHNIHRANHTAANLVWDATLAEVAQAIAASCVYQHNQTYQPPSGSIGYYGQNIGAGATAAAAPGLITNSMYNQELPNYPAASFGSNDVDTSNFAAWGHFSQIVWAATTSVGCYTQDCTATGLTFPNGGGAGIPPYFTVCNYSPGGNFVGQWSNVHAPIGNEGTIVVAT